MAPAAVGGADSRPAGVAVVGAGLAGGLLALALRRYGLAVTVVAPAAAGDPALATALSYGGVPGPGGGRAWQGLERRHGPLGWQRCGLKLHGGPPLLAPLVLPCGRVDTPTLLAALPGAWARAGVERLERRVTTLEPAAAAGGWRLQLAAEPGGGGDMLMASQVVLAAGAGSRALWPALPAGLRSSWAGVLALGGPLPAGGGLAAVRRGRLVLPRQFRRGGLERDPQPGRWCVDVGLAPWGEGALLGQISWLPEEEENAPPPWLEARLRQALAALDPELGRLDAPFRQVPVAFCSGGEPLLGPVTGAPGLWACCGFSGPFARLPADVEALAARMAAATAP